MRRGRRAGAGSARCAVGLLRQKTRALFAAKPRPFWRGALGSPEARGRDLWEAKERTGVERDVGSSYAPDLSGHPVFRSCGVSVRGSERLELCLWLPECPGRLGVLCVRRWQHLRSAGQPCCPSPYKLGSVRAPRNRTMLLSKHRHDIDLCVEGTLWALEGDVFSRYFRVARNQ